MTMASWWWRENMPARSRPRLKSVMPTKRPSASNSPQARSGSTCTTCARRWRRRGWSISTSRKRIEIRERRRRWGDVAVANFWHRTSRPDRSASQFRMQQMLHRLERSAFTSSTQDTASHRLTLFPTETFQFRAIVFRLWIAEAEISDKAPISGNIENRTDDDGIEDRHLTHAHAFGASRQPN